MTTTKGAVHVRTWGNIPHAKLMFKGGFPERLEDTPLKTHIVNACYKAGIQLTARLILELYHPNSPFLNQFESVDLEKIVDLFVSWGIIPVGGTPLCFFYQGYPPSEN
jgi:hypothetical protein